MAETLTLFKYDADIHFMLADDINKTVNPPMNNKIIKIYKGVDSVLNFYVKDKDRKPVSLASGTLTAYLVNHTTGNLLFSRLVEEIDNTTGQAKLTIRNKDLIGNESGFYDLSLTFENVDGETLTLFADRANNVKVAVEVKDGPIPAFSESATITFTTPGGTGSKEYSSAIEVASISPDTKGLHTFVAYLTNYIGNLHVEGSIDPIRDAELIETELLLADLQTIEKNIERFEKLVNKEKNADKKLRVLVQLKKYCDKGNMARTFSTAKDDIDFIESLFLLTRKPILYVANVDEGEIVNTKRNDYVEALFDFAQKENNLAIRLCGKIEQEIATLDKKEKSLFLDEYNLNEPGLNKLINAGFNLLGLETYFTGGPKEVRAWTINKGTTAPQAAGEIHTDFEKGFIKAEAISYDEFIKNKGWLNSKNNGKMSI